VTLAIVAFLVLSFLCWWLAARTREVRRTVSIVLACYAVIEVALAEQWIFPTRTYTMLTVSVLVTVTTLMVGIVVEEGRPHAAPFRFASARVRFGTLLSGAFAFFSVAAIVFFTFGVLAFGVPVSTPSSASVLPMPASLAVIANVDQGCGTTAGPQTVCTREIDIQDQGPDATIGFQVGSGSQRPSVARQEAALGATTARMAVNGMTSGYDWHLTSAPGQAWSGCRSVGSWLDRHMVCASVQVRHATAVILLTTSGDW